MPHQRDRSIFARLLLLLLALALVASACSDDDSSSDDEASDAPAEAEAEEASFPDNLEATGCAGPPEDGVGGEAEPEAEPEDDEGGELVDLGTFVGDPPEHIDPALNVTLDAYQLVNALYDGLTEVDSSDPENPEIKPLVAESVEPNDEATVWTFKIREGLTFSDGEPVVPCSFVRGWERATDPAFAGDYSYLYNFIEGGEEKLAGEAETISGVEADDEAMTLTVTLSAPYSNFDAVAGFQIFFPMPSAVEELDDQADWENDVMIGNGPYVLDEPRSEQEIVVVRNERWGGDIFGNKRAKLDKITFRTSEDPDSAYNAFEAGEGDTGQIPPGRVDEAEQNHGTTLDVDILGSYHFEVNWTDEMLGGPENVKLRQAISQAIDREEINEAVYNGSRTTSTGITPRGMAGFEEGLCDFCAYDPDAAKAAFEEWQADGNEQTEPVELLFNAGAGHEDVVQIMIDNLSAVGIDAEASPIPTETYFTQLSEGACRLCRSGWYADYPTYDNFMYDLFHSDAIGGNNHGEYSNPEFDELVDKAKETVDKDEQATLFRQAEDILLNKDIGVIPINWYRGDYTYDQDKLDNFIQTNLGLVLWEQISLK